MVSPFRPVGTDSGNNAGRLGVEESSDLEIAFSPGGRLENPLYKELQRPPIPPVGGVFGKELWLHIENASIALVDMKWWKLIISAFYAGIYLFFGGTAGAVLAADFADQGNVAASKIGFGVLFSGGLVFMLIVGATLFTSTSMITVVGICSGRIGWFSFVRVWITACLGNFGGVFAGTYFFGILTDIYTTEPVASFVDDVATFQVNIPFGTAFARAIPANWLVNIAVAHCVAATTVASKILGIIMPIITFSIAGFLHSVAASWIMVIPIFAGTASYSFGDYLWALVPIFLGNIVSGSLLMGFVYSYLNSIFTFRARHPRRRRHDRRREQSDARAQLRHIRHASTPSVHPVRQSGSLYSTDMSLSSP